jgi:uncharacterized protein YaaQ
MKMLMIIVDESKKEELEVFLNRVGVFGYTEISHAAGMGLSGPRLGSRAFPKTSAIVFTVVEDSALENLRQGIEALCETCGEEFKLIAWSVEQLH